MRSLRVRTVVGCDSSPVFVAAGSLHSDSVVVGGVRMMTGGVSSVSVDGPEEQWVTELVLLS